MQLRPISTAASREVLRRDWLLEDPVLRDLPNLKMAAGTNYPIDPAQAERLSALWDRTGRDWTRNESVAGLWAYSQTYGQQVSRLAGSSVAEVALAIGRAISGVYNNVMNFRAIDPRDQRAGMSRTGEVDRRVWSEFYDETTGDLRRGELDHEFRRLWSITEATTSTLTDVMDRDATLQVQAKALAASGLNTLLDRYAKERKTRPARPWAKSASTRMYDRQSSDRLTFGVDGLGLHSGPWTNTQ